MCNVRDNKITLENLTEGLARFMRKGARLLLYAERRISAKLRREAGPHWGGEAQVRAIRQGLLDARLTKAAINALNLLLNEKVEKEP